MKSLHFAAMVMLSIVLTTAAWAGPTAETVLPNGLTVLATQSDQTTLSGIALVIESSVADEPEGLEGARTVLQQAMVNRAHDAIEGTQRPLSAFVNPRSLGFDVNTDWDFVEVAVAVETDELGEALELLAGQAFGVELTEEELAEAVRMVQRGWDMSHAAPVQATFELFRRALYGDHPMGRPLQGDPSHLSEIPLDALQQFRDEQYVPANAFLCVVAPMTPEAITSAVTAVFGQVPTSPAPEPAQWPALPSDSRVEVDDSAGLVQASLVVGAPLPGYGDELRAAGELIAELLGGVGGRLRRDVGLLQALGLAVPSRLLQEHYPVGTLSVPEADHSYIAMHALCAPMSVERTRAGLVRHLWALRTHSVTDEELQRARRRVINKHRLATQRPAQQAVYLARRAMFGAGGADEAIAATESVTREDITAVANQYFGRHAVGVQMPAVRIAGENGS